MTRAPPPRQVAFPDGRFVSLDPAYVRRNDSSAKSVDEWTGRRLSRGADVADDVEPSEVALLGNYALQIIWPDGFLQVRHLLGAAAPPPPLSGFAAVRRWRLLTRSRRWRQRRRPTGQGPWRRSIFTPPPALRQAGGRGLLLLPAGEGGGRLLCRRRSAS